jgi:hypothetical protein
MAQKKGRFLLCDGCKMEFTCITHDIGRCRRCQKLATDSGQLILCRGCAKETNSCQRCQEDLGDKQRINRRRSFPWWLIPPGGG